MSQSFDDMLKSVLSDPEAIEKIGSLIGSVTQKEENSATAPPATSDEFLNMETLLKARELMSKISNEDDPRLNLLLALKPYLNKKRITRVDSAIKMLKVSKLMPLIKDFNIF